MVLSTICFEVTDPDAFLATVNDSGGPLEDVQGFNGM